MTKKMEINMDPADYPPEHEDVLKKTLKAYQKTMTEIPEEERNGRYKKSFIKLQKKLAKDTATYLKDYIFAGLWFYDNEIGRKMVKEVQDIVDKTELVKKAKRLVFDDMDFEKVHSLAYQTRVQIIDKVWWKYQASA